MSLLVVETCVQKSFLCVLSPLYHHLMKSETSIEQSVRLVFGVTYIVSFLALFSAIDNIFFSIPISLNQIWSICIPIRCTVKTPLSIILQGKQLSLQYQSIKKILRIIDSIFLLFSLGCLHWLMTLMWVWPRPNKINYFSPLFPIHTMAKLTKMVDHPTERLK